MQERSETIEGFRRLISSRYKTYGWIAGAIWLSGLILDTWFEPVVIYRSIISGMQLLGLIMLWYCFNHRYWMLFHFNTLNANPVRQLVTYFESRQKRWNDFFLLRTGIMAMLGLAMILLLVFDRGNVWAGITANLFLSFTLALMIKGWLDFNDSILLHDIRRSFPDQLSE